MNSLTPYDAYQLINSAVQQATGRSDLVATDTSSFVTVGETILRTGTENVLSAISMVLTKTIFSSRPYMGKLQSMDVSPERYGMQTRKITALEHPFEQTTSWNTQLSPNQLADGQSIDMYKIRKPQAVQLNFYGTKVLQNHITKFREQLSPAFHNEGEFNAFWSEVMVSFNNELSLGAEAERRLILLNFMAGISSMGLMEVDLTKAYNDNFGTAYTRQQLLSTYLESFMKFMAGYIEIWSDKLTDASVLYHANLTTANIRRHTPKSKQKMIMFNPLFTSARTNVFPTLFNPSYLNIGKFEPVNFWQSEKTPEQISITPNILDTATGASKTATTNVALPYVIGLLWDVEALGTVPQFDYTSTTPYNDAGEYYNMYVHWRMNNYNDYTENAVLFVMGAGGPDDPGETSELAANAEMKSRKVTARSVKNESENS